MQEVITVLSQVGRSVLFSAVVAALWIKLGSFFRLGGVAVEPYISWFHPSIVTLTSLLDTEVAIKAARYNKDRRATVMRNGPGYEGRGRGRSFVRGNRLRGMNGTGTASGTMFPF